MHRFLLAFLALVTIVSVGCFNESTLDPFNSTGTSTGGGGGGGGAGALDTATVVIFDNGFTPTSTLVSHGGSVTWVWTGGNAHGIVFDNTALSASAVQVTGTFRQNFPRAGIYSYYCIVHGRSVMSGTVTVQ